MKITKRKDEIAQLVELLESDEYASAEDLAMAVLQRSADIIAARHLYVVWARSYPDVLWGPYATQDQAAKAWDKAIAPAVGTAGGLVVPVAPWHLETYTPKTPTPTSVCNCGHPFWHHLNTKKGKGGWTTRCNTPTKRTGNPPCHCSAFTTPEAAA